MTVARSLASRLAATGLAFLAVAVASISLTLWVTWQLEGGAGAVNEAGRLRMLTYRMALDAAAGDQAALSARAAAFERTLELLRTGDPARPLFLPASDETRAEFLQVQGAWDRHRALLQHAQGPQAAASADSLVAAIDRLVGSIEHRLSAWTSFLRSFELAMVALAVSGALALLYMTHALILEPMRRVGLAIAALRRGERGSRVAPEEMAEFQELGEGFNAMAGQLEAQYDELAATVRERTCDLRAERERLEVLYEVSGFVARAETLDDMARGFVGRARRAARADAIALRWSDGENRRYLMLAQEGLPPAFVSAEQCIGTGLCLCGQVPGAPRSRVVPIAGEADPARARPCSRAGFANLLTVPVALHGRVYGELDLFYRSDQGPSEPVRSLVELLASHLAGGMQALRAAAADKEAAVSGERALLAQELHDSIAQSLAFLKIQVQLVRGALARGDAAALEQGVGEIEAGVMESYGDVRELLVHFRTRADHEEIEPALRTTLHKFHNQTGIATDIEVVGHGVALPNDVQVQVLHVVQEALSNVRKHAGACAVRLRVTQTPSWHFEVTDDGRGFDTAAAPDDGRVGMRIMAERARRVGGQLDVRSQPGRGTTVSLLLAPVTADEENVHVAAH